MRKSVFLFSILLLIGVHSKVLAQGNNPSFLLKMNKPPETGNKPFVELRKEKPVPAGSSKVDFKSLPSSGTDLSKVPNTPPPPPVQQQASKTDYSNLIRPKQPSGGTTHPPAPYSTPQKAKPTAPEPPTSNPYIDAARNFMQNVQQSGKN
jgi:hypothetical protein